MRPMTVTDIKRLNRDWRRRTRGSVSVALVSLSNPFNVGSIYRTAATLGADTVYLIGATPTALEPKVRKTSLGTEKAVQTVQAATLAEVADQVHEQGGVMTAVELAAGAVPIHEHAFPDNVCLVLGSERHGLSPSGLSRCDNAVFVAQPGKVASLNVSVAASLALYEFRRQHWVAE